MKQLIFLIALLHIFLFTNAQKLELSAYGGLTIYKITDKWQKIDNQSKYSPKYTGDKNYTVGLKALLSFKYFQCGLGIDYGNLSFSENYQINTIHYYYAAPYFSPHAIFNAKYSILSKSYIYLGVDFGIISTQQTKNNIQDSTTSAGTVVVIGGDKAPYILPGTGIIYGGHIGGAFYLSNRIGITIDGGIRVASIHKIVNYNCTYFPITAGLSYRL